VKKHGVMESLVVRPLGKNYQVMAGHRRMMAARQDRQSPAQRAQAQQPKADGRMASLLACASRHLVKDARVVALQKR
jgi:hypothetical protein